MIKRKVVAQNDRQAFERKAHEDLQAITNASRHSASTFVAELEKIAAAKPAFKIDPALTKPFTDATAKSRKAIENSLNQEEAVKKFQDDATFAARIGKMTFTMLDKKDSTRFLQGPAKHIMEPRLADFKRREPFTRSQLQEINMEPNNAQFGVASVAVALYEVGKDPQAASRFRDLTKQWLTVPPGLGKSRIIPAIVSLLRQSTGVKEFDIVFAN